MRFLKGCVLIPTKEQVIWSLLRKFYLTIEDTRENIASRIKNIKNCSHQSLKILRSLMFCLKFCSKMKITDGMFSVLSKIMSSKCKTAH